MHENVEVQSLCGKLKEFHSWALEIRKSGVIRVGGQFRGDAVWQEENMWAGSKEVDEQLNLSRILTTGKRESNPMRTSPKKGNKKEVDWLVC